MKLPVDELRDDILSLNLTWVKPDNVVCSNLSSEQMNDTDNTIIFITEAGNQPTVWANNQIVRWQVSLEVQIFWAVDTEINIQSAEIDLMKQLIEKGWLIEQSGSHTVDPDTQQTTKTVYVTNNKTI
jgi:hypothetical protein